MGPIEFYINIGSSENLHAQLAKQIEYYIAVGELSMGDRLPTIRELEKTLGINRNTIRKAYIALQKRGLLSIRRGSGVSVAIGPSPIAQRRKDPAVASLLEATLKQAKKLGYAPLQFLKLLQSKALEIDRENPSIAVAECSATQAQHLALGLEMTLGQATIGIDIGQLDEKTAIIPKSVQYVVVPIFHDAEVRKLLARKSFRIITVNVEIGQQFILAARRLLPAKRPCLVLRDSDSTSLIPNVIYRSLGLKMKIKPILMPTDTAANSEIALSDLVFYTAPCKQFIEDSLLPDRKRLEVILEFTADSIDLIQKTINV